MKQQRGFSLIEIMVVLVILGLLISIVAPNVLDKADSARTQKVFADFASIKTSLKSYRLDNFIYPTSEQGLEALVTKPSLDPIPKRYPANGYLEALPKDPWGNTYLYLSPGEHGEVDIYSLGADGVAGGEGVAADIGSWQTMSDFEQ